MKKNYMRPESTVMKIVTAPMLSASPNVTVSTNSEDNVDAESVDSRGFDDWD